MLVVSLLIFKPAYGQIRSGAAFLKMLPGARLQAMASGYTGGLDEVYALYANPGAAGFFREWQWAASYNKWIADVYSASVIYGRNFRTPLSRKTRVICGLLYYGVPEFDSSDRTAANASANDVLVSVSVGQPLTFLSDNISVGSNVKYLNSTLDEYEAGTFIFDVGISARTPRFSLNNSLLEYGIISAGVAVTQLGSSLKFDRVETPLPQTWRMGLAFYAGTHNGVQMQLLADYHNVKDEDGAFGLGAEFSWSRRFSLNGGYDFSSDLMSHVSFGASIRLDDIMMTEQTIMPGRNNALQFDLATVDEGEFFSRTYRGSVTHLPIAPEHFAFVEPAMGDSVMNRDFVLKWEQSRDPDLYDNVRYTLLVDRDSTKLAQVVANYDRKETDNFFFSLLDSSFLVSEKLEVDSFQVKNFAGGHYFWSVIAFDRDQHARFAETNGQRIADFYIPFPDVEINEIAFEYSPWITTDDYQGELNITYTNIGEKAAVDFYISIYDSTINLYHSTSDDEPPGKKLAEKRIELLKTGETQTIQIPWHTSQSGFHKINAVVDREQNVEEKDEVNNQYSQNFYTIPKGTFTCDDTVKAVLISRVTLDMPIITEVCFDTNSTVVKPEYLHKTIYDPPLAILAKRLKQNRHLKISLKGFADSNSGETDLTLANGRTAAVRDTLIRLGVNEDQIKMLPGKVLSKRRVPKNPLDAKWVFEERRFVEITSDKAGQATLFLPVRHTDDEKLPRSVSFHSQIKYAASINRGAIYCLNNELHDNIQIQAIQNQLTLQKETKWNPAANMDISPWINKNVNYYLSLTDTLGRTFRTHDKETYLKKFIFQREHRIAFPLKFAKTDPLYNFYWKRILTEVKKFLVDPDKQMRFTGHACAVGPENINERLSKKRANRFNKGFLGYVKKQDQKYYKQFVKRLDPAKGFGENKPLAIERLSGERILIGDNNSPLGRKLNRRIEVVISSDKDLVAQNF